MHRTPPFPVVLLLFFLSGATGLLYQIVWVRQFSFLFGATVLAVSTVLAAFMGGLALGGLWAGRVAHRWERPLRVYGFLEIALAVYAALVPFLLRAADPLYAALYGGVAGSFGALTAVRFVVSVLVLLPPTFLMGATLPLLTRHASGRDGGRRRVAHLYAVNTFGAVTGTLVATFALLPALGLRSTLLVGVGANLLIGAAAVVLGGRGRSPEAGAEAAPDPDTPGGALPFPRSLLYGAAGVLGFSALAFEVLWTRSLALSLGTTIYAFAVVLAVFLVGIAAGSLAAGRILRRSAAPAHLFVAAPAVIGLLALGLLPLFDRLPDLFVALTARGSGTWAQSVLVKLVLAAAPLLPPTLVSGAAFPLAIALDRRSAGHRAVGDVYASNTLGAILGSWAAGFVLLPAVGLQGGIELAAALPIATTALLLVLWRGPAAGRARGLAVAVLVIGTVATVAIPDWDLERMTRGGFVLGSDLQRSEQTDLGSDDSEVVFLEEGLSTTVTVRRDNGSYTMQMNGVTEASTAGDLSTQVSVASLPLLLHSGARDALIIGLGGGITAGTVGQFPGIERIDCVEISGAVARAAEAHFSSANRGILDDPRFRLLVGDGRNHLRLTRDTYDVVVSLPSHVWNSGIGSLMSAEFYSLCRERLRPGGILCSWIQGYSLSPDALRSVLAAVRASFPTVQLWRGAWGDLLIVAGDESLTVDAEQLRAKGRDAGVIEVLGASDYPDVASLVSLQILAGDALAAWTGRTEPNTDDRPTLEFAAPKLLYADPMRGLFESLYAAAATSQPRVEGAPAALVQRIPEWRRARALESSGRLALRDGEGEAALRRLEEAYSLLPTAPSIRRTLAGTLNVRAAGLLRRREGEAAARSYLRAIDVDPGVAESFAGLARMYLQTGPVKTALEIVEDGIEFNPDDAGLHVLHAETLIRMRQPQAAREAALRGLRLSPRHAGGFAALADAFERLGESARAESVLTAGLAIHPDADPLGQRLTKLRGFDEADR